MQDYYNEPKEMIGDVIIDPADIMTSRESFEQKEIYFSIPPEVMTPILYSFISDMLYDKLPVQHVKIAIYTPCEMVVEDTCSMNVLRSNPEWSAINITRNAHINFDFNTIINSIGYMPKVSDNVRYHAWKIGKDGDPSLFEKIDTMLSMNRSIFNSKVDAIREKCTEDRIIKFSRNNGYLTDPHETPFFICDHRVFNYSFSRQTSMSAERGSYDTSLWINEPVSQYSWYLGINDMRKFLIDHKQYSELKDILNSTYKRINDILEPYVTELLRKEIEFYQNH